MPALDVVTVRRLHRVDTIAMDTWVNVQVVSAMPADEVQAAVHRALRWLPAVERAASRFDRNSEVMRLAHRTRKPVPVSRLLLESVSFALELARLSDGLFDPTVGALLEQRGFNENYRGGVINSGVSNDATYRDVRVDRATGTITLRKPLVLDLGAVAKGMAMDLVARDLHAQGYADVSVEAGGDVFARGRNVRGEAWQIGIEHPRIEGLLVRTLSVDNAAVCTSADSQRGAHIIDARTGEAASGVASVSVIAPTAMMADGLSTVAMLLRPHRARPILEREGASVVYVSDDQ